MLTPFLSDACPHNSQCSPAAVVIGPIIPLHKPAPVSLNCQSHKLVPVIHRVQLPLSLTSFPIKVAFPLVHQAAVTPVSLHHKAPQRPQFYSLDSRNPCQIFAWLILTCLSSQWMYPACLFIVHFPLPSIPDLSHPALSLLMQQMQADCLWSVSITSSPPEQGDSLFTNVSQTRTRVTLNAFKASE